MKPIAEHMARDSICPGRFLADDIIWITVANVLSLFDILPMLDSDTGKEIYPKLEFVSGTTW